MLGVRDWRFVWAGEEEGICWPASGFRGANLPFALQVDHKYRHITVMKEEGEGRGVFLHEVHESCDGLPNSPVTAHSLRSPSASPSASNTQSPRATPPFSRSPNSQTSTTILYNIFPPCPSYKFFSPRPSLVGDVSSCNPDPFAAAPTSFLHRRNAEYAAFPPPLPVKRRRKRNLAHEKLWDSPARKCYAKAGLGTGATVLLERGVSQEDVSPH